MLNRLIKGHPRILPAGHIEARGTDLFRLVCQQDLEGIVAKWANGRYGERWYKIRNPVYSQYLGRRELFQRKGQVAAGA